MADEILHGSCLCGGVRYEIRGALTAMARCHCVQCRKASGAEFATNATVATEDFEFLEGRELLCDFESSLGNERVFCGRCGSPILKRVVDKPESVRVRLGCLDSPLEQRPALRVFASERCAFTDIDDDIPTFDTVPGA